MNPNLWVEEGEMPGERIAGVDIAESGTHSLGDEDKPIVIGLIIDPNAIENIMENVESKELAIKMLVAHELTHVVEWPNRKHDIDFYNSLVEIISNNFSKNQFTSGVQREFKKDMLTVGFNFNQAQSMSLKLTNQFV